MELKMTEVSKHFLENNCPEILRSDSLREALDSLYNLIELKGFAPPDYYDYNEFGREAQRVYDDLYLSNGE